MKYLYYAYLQYYYLQSPIKGMVGTRDCPIHLLGMSESLDVKELISFIESPDPSIYVSYFKRNGIFNLYIAGETSSVLYRKIGLPIIEKSEYKILGEPYRYNKIRLL